MDSIKIRRPRKEGFQVGASGRIIKLWYSTGAKINLGHGTYSTVDTTLGAMVKLEEEADVEQVWQELRAYVNQKAEEAAQERLDHWNKEFGIDDKSK